MLSSYSYLTEVQWCGQDSGREEKLLPCGQQKQWEHSIVGSKIIEAGCCSKFTVCAAWRNVGISSALGRSVGRRDKKQKIVGLEKKQLVWPGEPLK